MKTNMGTIDCSIRGVVGIAVIAAGIYTQSWWSVIGLVLLITAGVAWCPVYRPFGLSTCKK